MSKLCTLAFLLLFSWLVRAQTTAETSTEPTQDSIKKSGFLKQLADGYLPTKYFNFDLRYLVKYNQYEALRTGLGGITNDAFSEKFRINSYVVYGFKDHRFKYSIGAGFRIAEKTNTWLDISYTDDLQETGSYPFLTDKRFFQLFEPRLLNISLFHKIISRSISLEYQLSPNILAETQLSINDINPTYAYEFALNGANYNLFNLSLAKIAVQWSPFSNFELAEKGVEEGEDGFPKFTFQYTKSFKDVFEGDFNFSNFEFKTIQQIQHKNKSLSEITIVSGISNGHAPLTHLYHAYPNNINKEKILRRFSVAGTSSFETMFFNEFFSDKFTTLQIKHALKPFNISEKYKPQLVLISRFAIGDMDNIDRHQNISFGTLEKGYSESGFEINKLFFGFGLSFAYRYGAYHLPNIDDNIAFKFTFNLTL
ncbi:hypothetical protein [Confluentibacter flavum]|uniref:Bacterial surface antigen (D15) domain-containing protein n=1 Tax=Confluentibacter flavum TaxID=1909700 RepID=A0A2N3HPS8_9FLAO|nr:hypothetical protein [Confluentibacter flavum]PKQ46864.1 hypothetical protein CSW08_00705 [Confluentibacter flavum]